MEKYKLSIIVPVYNVELYLQVCIRSLIKQTYRNIEVVLVDDGSPDQSGKICDYWAHKDNRICVIHTKNQGAARARNEGIKIAKGDFIAFVDSDDFISPCMFETLIRLINEYDCDIAECDFCTVFDNDYKFENNINNNIKVVDAQTALKYHIQNKLFKQTVWNKVYRKTVILPFTEGKYIDDEFWMYQVIGKSRQLVSTSAKLYAYRQQSQSVMHARYSIKRLDALEAMKRRCDYINKNYPVLDQEARLSLFFSCVYQYQMSLKYLYGKEKKKSISTIKKYITESRIKVKDLSNVSYKQRIWGILLIISFGGTCRLRNFLHYGF